MEWQRRRRSSRLRHGALRRWGMELAWIGRGSGGEAERGALTAPSAPPSAVSTRWGGPPGRGPLGRMRPTEEDAIDEELAAGVGPEPDRRSDLQRVTRALRASELSYRRLLEAAQDGS